MAPPLARELKVGLVVLSALAVLGAGLLILGDKNNLFTRKNHYYIRFGQVGGLAAGSPVTLDGVNVGSVNKVVLAEDPKESEIQVWLSVDSRYARRLRTPDALPGGAPPPPAGTAPPTRARIKTQGLLGDKYIELNSGALAYPIIPDGTEIEAAATGNLEHLMASGEDVMANVTQISHSLLNILGRIDRGEGLLGDMTTESPTGKQLRASTLAAMQTVQRVAAQMETGPGVLPRLLNDRALANRLSSSVDRLNAVLASAQSGPGVLPGLLNDPRERQRLDDVLANLDAASRDLQAFSNRLDTGQGLLPKLLSDEAYGREVSGHLRSAVEHLDTLSDRLVEGNGTAARLLNDPRIYDAINDIIVGVNRSWMLRWLIQNRQKAGIKQRYQDATGGSTGQPGGPTDPPPGAAAPSPPPPGPPSGY